MISFIIAQEARIHIKVSFICLIVVCLLDPNQKVIEPSRLLAFYMRFLFVKVNVAAGFCP